VKYIAYTLLTIVAFVLLWPTLMLVVGSIRTDDGLVSSVLEIIPRDITLVNYRQVFRYTILRWTQNSIFTAAGAAILTAFVVMTAGYAFAKKPIPGKEIIFWTMLGAMMVPGTVTFVPMYVLMLKLGLLNTLWGIILPSGLQISFIFYMRQFLSDLPDSFLDAAEIDGCGELRTFSHVVFPLARPGLATIVLLTTLGQWNSFLWPLTVLFDREKFTLPVGIQQILFEDAMLRSLSQFEPQFGLMMAGGTYLMIPGVILFIVFNRYFVRGLWGGSMR